MNYSIIGTRNFRNKQLLYDVLNVFYYEDPFITIRSGGTSKVSQWAEEWAIVNGANWNTRFEYWNKSDVDTEFWLKCHADLLLDTDQGIVFWDGECKDTPIVFDIAKEMEVPLMIILCENNNNTFYIL